MGHEKNNRGQTYFEAANQKRKKREKEEKEDNEEFKRLSKVVDKKFPTLFWNLPIALLVITIVAMLVSWINGHESVIGVGILTACGLGFISLSIVRAVGAFYDDEAITPFPAKNKKRPKKKDNKSLPWEDIVPPKTKP